MTADYFHAGHPLARAARARCQLLDHPGEDRIGAIACGRCWEIAIRDDERALADEGIAPHDEPDGPETPTGGPIYRWRSPVRPAAGRYGE